MMIYLVDNEDIDYWQASFEFVKKWGFNKTGGISPQSIERILNRTV